MCSMVDLRTVFSWGVMAEEAKDCDRVKGWLEEAHIDDLETGGNGSHEDKRIIESGLQPVTPPPRPQTVPRVRDEISPTDTSFSGRSIFDAPLHKKPFHGSPSPGVQIADDESDTTGDGEGEWEPTLTKERTLGPEEDRTFEGPARIPISSPDTLNFQDPLSYTDIQRPPKSADAASQALTHDSNLPRVVWLTSCLQCTLAHLPCSRTYPSCSRCQRTGKPDLCLLHRRCFAFEALDPSMLDKCRKPILLKVKGEDEAIWQGKVNLAKELREKWEADQEVKNWVMPAIESERGGWKKKHSFRTALGRDSHPGEGYGRMSYTELVVDLDA